MGQSHATPFFFLSAIRGGTVMVSVFSAELVASCWDEACWVVSAVRVSTLKVRTITAVSPWCQARRVSSETSSARWICINLVVSEYCCTSTWVVVVVVFFALQFAHNNTIGIHRARRGGIDCLLETNLFIAILV